MVAQFFTISDSICSSMVLKSPLIPSVYSLMPCREMTQQRYISKPMRTRTQRNDLTEHKPKEAGRAR